MADNAAAFDPETDHFDFDWDIAMALRDTTLYRGRGQRFLLKDKMALARTILRHLSISGALLSRKPPLDGHGRRPPQSD
jgi:hypothetical protein